MIATEKTHDEIATATHYAEIQDLMARANEALARQYKTIAEDADCDGQVVSLRLKRHSTIQELVGVAAWLVHDLVDVLHKVAAGDEPYVVMTSVDVVEVDHLPSRIREAEIRLELLWKLIRS